MRIFLKIGEQKWQSHRGIKRKARIQDRLNAGFLRGWGGKWDSNPRQPESQSGTLPTELFPPQTLNSVACPAGIEPATVCLEGRCSILLSYGQANRTGCMVGVKRFELPTSCSQSRRATRLRHTPRRLIVWERTYVRQLIHKNLHFESSPSRQGVWVRRRQHRAGAWS